MLSWGPVIDGNEVTQTDLLATSAKSLTCIHNFFLCIHTQLTDQPLKLFKDDHFIKMPTLLVNISWGWAKLLQTLPCYYKELGCYNKNILNMAMCLQSS